MKTKTVLELFGEDIGTVREQINSGEQVMTSYVLYASFETKDGTTNHLATYNAQYIDALIGRLEMLKSCMIERHYEVNRANIKEQLRTNEDVQLSEDASNDVKYLFSQLNLKTKPN